MPPKNTPFSKLRYAVVGVAMKLQNRIGRDHEESVYHKMLLTDLQQAGYAVEDRPRLHLCDAQGKRVATYVPDLRLTHGEITLLLELKAEPGGLQASHRRQARRYLKTDTEARAALLLNFGSDFKDPEGRRGLEWEAIFRTAL